MLAPTERAPHRPSPLPLPSALLAAELGQAVMADDPCEAAFSAADPTGPRNYYRARYYDPKLGRFLSEEPLPMQDRPLEELHPYVYVMNNPVNHVDPLGLSASDWLPCVVRINREVIAGYCGNGKNAADDPSCREAHCIANCRIARECPFGGGQAAAASYAKEVWDWGKKKSWDPTSEGYSGGDQAANKKGRICGKSPYTRAWDCEELCKGTR